MASMASPRQSQITPANQGKWDEIQAMSIDDQATTFLKAFILDFSGNKFEEVLDIAQEFKKYVNEGLNVTNQDLEEHQAHLFLERRGETLTAAALREILKEIDVDNNHRVAFIEYALFTWKKTVDQFFKELATPKGGGAELEKAIAAYRAVLKVRADREAKMAELEKTAALGGVKGMAAKNTLEQMKSEDQLAMNRNEITAGAKKRAAEKNATDPFEEEKKRAEREKQERAAEEEKKRQESRAKLAARAGAFGAVSPSAGAKSPSGSP